MKNKTFLKILLIIIFLIPINKIYADEFYFEGSIIEILKNEEEIIGKDGVKITTNNNIEIIADKFKYNKKKLILYAEGNILINDYNNKLKIKSDKIIYYKKLEKIISNDDTFINLDNEYYINSKNLEYIKNKNIISSTGLAKVVDNFENYLELNGFNYHILKKELKSKKVKFTDNQGNIHYSNETMLNLLTKEMVGKDIDIDFKNDLFNNNENEPRLKGNYFSTNKNLTKIKKGVFTTCKKKDTCPPWVIHSEEITHDKNKKTINYKNAWLKVYGTPVFYFPKFFHPDPTVKRQSGFLMPSIKSSNTIGSSISVPYFKVISENKDLTFYPRIYSNSDILLQTEYRQINKNSDLIADFSVKKYGINQATKSHFFSSSSINLGLSGFDESKIDFDIQQTSSDSYLKSHNMSSPIINSLTTLKNLFSFTASSEDVSLMANLEVYEDLSKDKNSDKFEYVPTYSFSKLLENSLPLKGIINFSSDGNRKLFNTNVLETTVVNDLIFNSDSFFFNNGVENNYSVLMKNVLSNSNNSSTYKNEFDSKLYSQFVYQSSYPLIKVGSKVDRILSPKISFMYSPNATKNIKDTERRIDINNIYSLNRIGVGSTVEGGESLTIGSEYDLIKKNGKELASFDVGAVIRKNKNPYLPKTAKIGENFSDIVGNLKITPSDIININYDFSMDNSLDRFNYNFLELKLKVNNFVTSFEYLEEDHEIGSNSYISNKIGYKFDTSNSINFATRRNRKTNLTEFYNLMYQYENDCLTAAIEYNKDYYADTGLNPSEEIFFSITIIPLSKINTPNIQR